MTVVYNILIHITLIFSIYFAITGLWAFKKSKIISEKEKFNKFAILIACRNESEVIGNLIDSLNASNYPKNKFDIIALPNNCTDNTKEVAILKNAKVIDIRTQTKTKGDVLKYAFKHLKNSDYDAYIIIDADNLVHENFLASMNDGLNSGYKVAQGFRDAKNPNDNWLTGSYTMFYYLQNFFFNKARLSLNSSATINGTGFMIAKSIIDEYGFNTVTLTEDSEFTGLCALNNIQVGFIHNAIIYDEHPTKFSDSWRQRRRWSSGLIACFKYYSLKLIKTFFKTRNLSSLDMTLFYSAPLIQVLSLIFPIITFIIDLTECHFINVSSIIFFLVLYLLNVIINIFIIKIYHKKIRHYYKGIIFFSFFILSWIPINIVCLIKRTNKWEPIKHTRNIKIENINN